MSTEANADAKTKKRRKIKIIIIIALIAVIGATAYVSAKMMIVQTKKTFEEKLKAFDYVSLKGKDLSIDPKVKKDLKNYRNILLIGIDARKGEDNDKTRSDAIVIMTINKNTNKFELTSVLRDTYLDIEEEGYHTFDKINHAHAYGGPVNLIRALNRNMDLNIDSFIRVNWQTVADISDAFGGVTMNIKDYEIDEMNRYVADTNRSLNGSKRRIKKAGRQKLNGVQTVTYCRIRHVGNGDMERAQRMRRVARALMKKATAKSLKELFTIADRILPQIKTSISPKDMMSLLIGYNKLELAESNNWPDKIVGLQLPDGSGMNIWYDIPVTIKSSVQHLHKDLFGQKKYMPTKRVLNISQQVINKTGLTDYSNLESTNKSDDDTDKVKKKTDSDNAKKNKRSD